MSADCRQMGSLGRITKPESDAVQAFASRYNLGMRW